MTTLVHVIPGWNPVTGLAAYADRLYVVREPSERHVEVYVTSTATSSSSPFQLQRKLLLNDLGDRPRGLVACAFNKCLYISDSGRFISTIHRLDLQSTVNSGEQIENMENLKKWKVNYATEGISISNQRNLLVACRAKSVGYERILEFATFGDQIREIVLQPDITWLRHVVQLPDDNRFVISHGQMGSFTTLNRVCTVDETGRVIVSYGNNAGSACGEFNGPQHLVVVPRAAADADAAVRASEAIFVADCGNSRILSLNPSRIRSDEVRLPTASVAMNGPFALCLHASLNRLYVGEFTGNRILVFDGVICLDLNNV